MVSAIGDAEWQVSPQIALSHQHLPCQAETLHHITSLSLQLNKIGPYALTMNRNWPPQPHPSAYTASDSTDGRGLAFASPLGTASLGHDGFSHDPGFLASQEELRCMLFTIAQSAAPTRAGSPDVQADDDEERQREERLPVGSALSNGRRVEYLKNYVGQVAPWVSRRRTSA